MSKKAIYLVTITVMIFSACSSRENNEYVADEGRGIDAVRVLELDYSEIARSSAFTAHVEAYRDVHLASASPGRIEKIHVDVGDIISKGQLLVTMDKTQLHQARVQLQSVETDYRRIDTLRRVGSISQQQYDQIRTQYELAKSNVAFLEENTTLQAPFSGVVSERYFEGGEMFSGAPNTPAGKAAILSLVQTSRLKALVNVSERFFPYVSAGMPVELNLDVYPGEVFEGRVHIVYPVIDTASRSFRVEIHVDNPGERLRPGMFARATFDFGREEAFVAPAIAVLKLQGSDQRYLFLEENGKAKRVDVKIGDRFDDRVEIISDEINRGDRLIVAGQARLLDGVPVRVEGE